MSEGGLMTEIFELYDALIQSEDIREFFKKEWLMSVSELEKLIIHARVSLIEKLSYLIWLRDYVAYGKDKKILAEMVDLYEKAIYEIYHRSDERIEYKISNIRLDSDSDDTDLTSFFSTYLSNERIYHYPITPFDVLADEKNKLKHSHVIPHYKVVQSMRQADGTLIFNIAYTLTWLQGVLSAIDFVMPEAFVSSIGVRMPVYYRIHETLRNFPLPFGNNSEIRIITPMMKKPLHGRLTSTLDEMDNWTHTFKPFGDYYKNCPPLDLSFQKIDISSDFNTFDSIESLFMW